ncbi:hypothetical protein HK101_007691 [Irineochytrium annulatum]|nr:hypothetical protein HK101_007691 [Irineochytrium annulatum]
MKPNLLPLKERSSKLADLLVEAESPRNPSIPILNEIRAAVKANQADIAAEVQADQKALTAQWRVRLHSLVQQVLMTPDRPTLPTMDSELADLLESLARQCDPTLIDAERQMFSNAEGGGAGLREDRNARTASELDGGVEDRRNESAVAEDLRLAMTPQIRNQINQAVMRLVKERPSWKSMNPTVVVSSTGDWSAVVTPKLQALRRVEAVLRAYEIAVSAKALDGALTAEVLLYLPAVESEVAKAMGKHEAKIGALRVEAEKREADEAAKKRAEAERRDREAREWRERRDAEGRLREQEERDARERTRRDEEQACAEQNRTVKEEKEMKLAYERKSKLEQEEVRELEKKRELEIKVAEKERREVETAKATVAKALNSAPKSAAADGNKRNLQDSMDPRQQLAVAAESPATPSIPAATAEKFKVKKSVKPAPLRKSTANSSAGSASADFYANDIYDREAEVSGALQTLQILDETLAIDADPALRSKHLSYLLEDSVVDIDRECLDVEDPANATILKAEETLRNLYNLANAVDVEGDKRVESVRRKIITLVQGRLDELERATAAYIDLVVEEAMNARLKELKKRREKRLEEAKFLEAEMRAMSGQYQERMKVVEEATKPFKRSSAPVDSKPYSDGPRYKEFRDDDGPRRKEFRDNDGPRHKDFRDIDGPRFKEVRDDGPRHKEFRDNDGPRHKDFRDSPNFKGLRKTKSCHFFNTPQGCKNGENCKFSHGEDDINPEYEAREREREAQREGPEYIRDRGSPRSKQYRPGTNGYERRQPYDRRDASIPNGKGGGSTSSEDKDASARASHHPSPPSTPPGGAPTTSASHSRTTSGADARSGEWDEEDGLRRPQRERRCRYFSNGYCRNGDMCDLAHVENYKRNENGNGNGYNSKRREKY